MLLLELLNIIEAKASKEKKEPVEPPKDKPKAEKEPKKEEPKEEPKAEPKKEVGGDMKETKAAANRIAHLLFKQKAGPVVDKKRSKDPIYWGVVNTESVSLSAEEVKIKLTFDNSTDSGEFEINSLTPLSIERGSPMDKAVKQLYSEFKVASSKKTNYTLKADKMVLREVHLGKQLADKHVDFVKALLHVLRARLAKTAAKEKA